MNSYNIHDRYVDNSKLDRGEWADSRFGRLSPVEVRME